MTVVHDYQYPLPIGSGRNLCFKDAMTNPTLLLTAVNKPQYAHSIDIMIKYSKNKGRSLHDQACLAMDRLVSLLYV